MKLNKRYKLVFGVGINDADYNVVKSTEIQGKTKISWVCPFYMKWKDMLSRCYSENNLNKNPTYIGSSVFEPWKTFTNFRTWMVEQDWQGKDLDKDLLFYGNKVYGPETCCFIDQAVNKFLTERENDRGDFPIGVSLTKSTGKFRARCMCVITGKRVFLGDFKTPEEAHNAWLTFKLSQAYILAESQTDDKIANALVQRYENYNKI